MLSRRLAVAAVGLPLLALLVAGPERLFSAVVALALGGAAFEIARAALPGAPRSTYLGASVAAALVVAGARTLDWFEVGTLVPVVTLALYVVLRPHALPEAHGPAWWLVAVLYPGVLGAHFVLLRLLEEGQWWLVVMLSITFATDTGAYAIGRLFGRHRMAPRLSPKKTWEGALGGYVAGAAAAVIATRFLDAPPSMAVVAVMALALPPLAEVGDLLESAVKRRLEVKDMSHLLPGHGGLMDRLDSLLAVGPGLYWLVRWFT
jgi:phosphatidate cytidylyltransferase